MKYKVAALQFVPDRTDKEKNIKRIFSYAEAAVKEGAKLIVTFEMATTGYCWHDRYEIENFGLEEEIPGGETIRKFKKFAYEHDCYFVLGMIEKEDERLYNSAVIIGPQGYIDKYRKVHLFPAECKWSKQGDLGIKVIDTPIGKIGLGICLDSMYVELARTCALKGADILCFLVQWPSQAIIESTWISEAYDNNVHVVVANRKGDERGYCFPGGSAVINPYGDITGFLGLEEGYAISEVDLDNKRPEDTVFERRPELYYELQRPTYLWDPQLFFNMYGKTIPAGDEVKLSAAQFKAENGNIENNLVKILSYIEKASEDNTDVLVLPELILTGRPVNKTDAEKIALEIDSNEIQKIVNCVVDRKINAVMGFALKENASIFNAVVAISSEGDIHVYKKSHLNAEERLWADRGNEPPAIVDFEKIRIGLIIGDEIFSPELTRLIATKACDAICVCADTEFIGKNYDFLDSDVLFWHVGRCRMSENNIITVFANQNNYSAIFIPSNNMVVKNQEKLLGDSEGYISETTNTKFYLENGLPNSIRFKPLISMRQPLWYDQLYKK